MGAIEPYDSNKFLDADKYPSVILDSIGVRHAYAESFQDLKIPTPILKSLFSNPEVQGTRPNRLQSKTIRYMSADHHLIVQARLSSGIQTCFALGILVKLNLMSASRPQAIVMCPTVEISKQFNDLLRELGKFTRLRSEFVQGPSDFSPTSHVIVGVPETIRHLIVTTQKINPFSAKTALILAADQLVETPHLKDFAAEVVKLIDDHHCKILVSYSTWTNNVSTFFRESLKRVRLWNKIFVNLEEYSVFYSRLHKLVFDGNYAKAVAVGKSLDLLSNEEQVIIYARPGAGRDILSSELNKFRNRGIVYAPDPAMRGVDDPLIKFKSREARILVTSIPLVSGYAESRFDESNVNLVIFYDLPLAREGKIDYECYYRLATRAGINCNPRRGCVLHLVSKTEERLMVQLKGYSGRVVPWYGNEFDGEREVIQLLESCHLVAPRCA